MWWDSLTEHRRPPASGEVFHEPKARSDPLTRGTIPTSEGVDMDNMDQVKGKVKQAVGDLTGNKDLKKKGKADEKAGEVKEFVAGVKDKADDLVDKVKGKIAGQ
jgi:uncharacterized protein YjbJ (UPF0337 family)